MNNKSELERELKFEYLRSERVRVLSILFLFFASLVFVPVLTFTAPQFTSIALNNPQGINAFVISISIFFLFEIAVFARIQYMITRKIIPPFIFQYINTIIEFALPGIIIYYTVFYDQSILVMEYDGFDFYIILIILSTLHLNWRLNILAGAIAGIGYGLVSFWAFNNLPIEGDLERLKMIYLARSISLLIFGGMAGVVAYQFAKKIQKAVNYRAQRQHAQQILGQQVSEEVVGEILKTGDTGKPKIADASIMFMDIKDFSVWADNNTPEDVMNYQNAVFSPIIEIITKNNGTINQLLGDGFMASFGISKTNEDYVQQAFDAGLEIIEKIKELENAEVIPPTFIRIGLHRGNIVTGNIGNKIRKQFSLAGKNIIVAARLEELNKKYGTQFLISGDIKKKIKEGGYVLEDYGLIKMKGIDNKIDVYNVKIN